MACPDIYMRILYVRLTRRFGFWELRRLSFKIIEINIIHYENTGFGQIVDMKKFTKGASGSPQCNCYRVTNAGCRVIGPGESDSKSGEFFQDICFRGLFIYTLYRIIYKVFSQWIPIVVFQTFTNMHFSYQCRKHMRCLKIIIIIGSKKICRHNWNIICTILNVVWLAHFDTRDLRDCIWFISIFQLSCQ